MMTYDYLFACTSWEDRFTEGLEHTLKNENITRTQLFEIEEFADRTHAAKTKSLNLLSGKNHDEILPISMLDDIKSWKILEQKLVTCEFDSNKVLIDISTMPRFLIWFLIHFLQRKKCAIYYRYYSPLRYGDCTWLSGEPEEPRLIFKHSGIHLPDRGTALILQSGFDTERIAQLINMYEPSTVLLAGQTGSQYDNLEKNIKKHKETLSFQEIVSFEIDAFSPDHGFSVLSDYVGKYIESHNIIMSSFGPKPSAIAMYKINLAHPEVGLVYVPATDYNSDYSFGTRFDNMQSGEIHLPDI